MAAIAIEVPRCRPACIGDVRHLHGSRKRAIAVAERIVDKPAVITRSDQVGDAVAINIRNGEWRIGYTETIRAAHEQAAAKAEVSGSVILINSDVRCRLAATDAVIGRADGQVQL